MSSAIECDIAKLYEFEMSMNDANTLKKMLELALQHGRSKDERSAVVWDYLNREVATSGMVVTSMYGNIYYSIGVATYSIP